MNFEFSDKVKDLHTRLTVFMDQHIYPNEPTVIEQTNEGDRWEPLPIIENLKEKAERISPASRGLSHFSFCSSVAYRTNVSMFPVSGAEQLNTSGAHGDRPMISHNGAYS